MYSAKKAKLCVTFYFKVFKPKTNFSFRVEEMSLPECEGPANSTLCFLPELLEELQKSETVRFQDFIKVWTGCIYQGLGEVNVVGKNQTEELEDFEVFNIRNTVNIIAYSVMSTGAEIWNILYESLITDFVVVRDWIIALLESRLIFMIFSGNHSQQCCTSHCWAPVKKVWYDNM